MKTATTMDTMLSEDEFLQHAEDLENMSTDEYLEHYGKKGMKWGQKMAEVNMGVYAKSRNARKDGVEGKQTKEQRGNAIDAARGRIATGENRRNFKEAKSAYKAAKHTEGAAAAKAAFRAVKDKNVDDAHDSNLAKSGGEKVAVALIAAGAVAINIAIQARA